MSDLDPLLSPDKGIGPTEGHTIGGRTLQIEAMCTYKTAHILSMFTSVSEQIDLVSLLAAIQNESPVSVALRALPRIMAVAPDALIRAVALAMVPNAELESLFKQGAGAIEGKVNENMAFLHFNGTAEEVLDLANAYLPVVGVDALKNALTRLGQTVSQTLGLNREPPPNP